MTRTRGVFLLGLTLAKSPARIEPGLQDPRHRAIAVEQTDRVVVRVGHHIQPRRAVLLRRTEQALEARLQMQQHRFDVFAGAQAVDAEIHAVAGELPLPQIAHFHRVRQPTARLDAEIGEDRVTRVGV